MSVSIKLSRFGAKKAAFYRIVAQTTRSKRDGKSLDIIGWYNPIKKTKEINKALFDEWVGKGAIVTDAVKNLIDPQKTAKKVVKTEEKKDNKQTNK